LIARSLLFYLVLRPILFGSLYLPISRLLFHAIFGIASKTFFFLSHLLSGLSLILGIRYMSILDSAVTSQAKKPSPEYYRQRRQQLRKGIIQRRHAVSTKNNIESIKRRWRK